MTRILVIEDDTIIRNNLVDLLDAEDFEVAAVSDGGAGVTQAKAMSPDLIICDVMMPVLDGYGVLAELRGDPMTAAIPFIFLTARAEKSDMRQGMSLGADDYLTKPFTSKELLQAIQARLLHRAAVGKKFEERLSMLRDNLARALPHEFRTPITSIMSASELLLELCEGPGREDLHQCAAIIHRGGARLNRLADNYLFYAELETTLRDPARVAGLHVSRTRGAAEVISDLCLNYASQARRDADLQVLVQGPDVGIAISEDHFARLMHELMDNACKYSPANTPILVTGNVVDHRFVISVVDRGRGMVPEQLAAVGAYMQFDRQIHEQQGLGLGLAIVRSLVELYDGQVSITSRPGEGVTVWVSLPVC